ncbi:MAG: ScyD/ScyE family protein [Dehalococcoidia bacterium]
MRTFSGSMVCLLVLAGVVGMGTGLAVARALEESSSDRREAMTGLSAPRGLTSLDGGGLLIAEVLGGRLLRMSPDGDVTVVQEGLPATYGGPGGSYPIGISSAILVGTNIYYVVGEFRGSRYSTLYRLENGQTPEALAGGVGPDGFPSTPLTNPYDLVPAPHGGVLVSDSGLNAVLHITEEGDISEYATFPERRLEDGLQPLDVVPTGLAFGHDGALYLASFTGYPYPQDAAYVYRLEDTNNDGDAIDTGESTVFAGGFSVATDLAFEEDGALLVTEFSTDMGTLVEDFGIPRAGEIPGRLLRLRDGEMEVVAEGLVSPTSVATGGSRIFVSEEFAGVVTEIGPTGGKRNLGRMLGGASGLAAAFAVWTGLRRAGGRRNNRNL